MFLHDPQIVQLQAVCFIFCVFLGDLGVTLLSSFAPEDAQFFGLVGDRY
jgi:hypothetical protein